MLDALEQLRKARNHCAHHVREVNFGDQKIRAHIQNFVLPYEVPAPDESDRHVCLSRLVSLNALLLGWVGNASPILKGRTTRGEVLAHYNNVNRVQNLDKDPRFNFD